MQQMQDLREKHPGMNKALVMSATIISKIQGEYVEKCNVTMGDEFRTAFRSVQMINPNFEWNFAFCGGVGGNNDNADMGRVILGKWMESILNNKDTGDDVLTKSNADLRRYFPGTGRVIIDEQDLYMFCKLK